jgi:hypothetical protein
MNMSRLHSILLATALGLSAALPASAAVSLPSWNGQPNTTSQVFLFNTASTTPSANNSVNPYGTASASVVVGFFGNGWENPADAPASNPGFNGDGAWDVGTGIDSLSGNRLGPDGSITFSVPVAPAAPGVGQSYRLDILIYAVAYQDLHRLPEASVLGLAPGDLVLASSNVLGTRPPNGTWRELTWTAVKEGHTTGALSVALTPPTGEASVIDRVEIYTRYTLVPEPSSAVLLMLAGATVSLRRRRTVAG